jgi:all-trans-retinol 13,14-reductase
VFPHGYDPAIKALADKYPEDNKGIKRFMKLVAGIRKEGLKLPRIPL